MNIFNILNLKSYKYISFVGAGGKTSLINVLAHSLGNKKIAITTTTKILKPLNFICNFSEESIKLSFESNNIVTFGLPVGEKLSQPSNNFFKYIDNYADYILIEADGANRLSFKAPNKTEPVYLDKNQCTIIVAGISVIDKDIDKFCHRPEYIKKIIGNDINFMSPVDMAKVIIEGYIKNIKSDFRIIINQVDSKKDYTAALEVSKILEEKLGTKPLLLSLNQRRIIDASTY